MSETSWVADVAPKDDEAPLEASLPNHEGTFASSTDDGPAGQVNDQETTKPEASAPQKPSVRTWWEVVYGNNPGFSAEYLLDHSIRWSENAYETIVRPQDTDSAKRELTPTERIEIIESIAALFKEVCPEILDEQPFTHFRGQDVHIRLERPAFLEALWKTPISFKGRAMLIKSKGLVGGGVKVFKVQGMEAKKLEDFKKRLQRIYYQQPRLIVAGMYEVDSLGGGPIFSGDLLWFSDHEMTEFEDRGSILVNS